MQTNKEAWIAEKEVSNSTGTSNITIASVALGWFHTSEECLMKRVNDSMPEFHGWLIPKMGDYKKLAKKIIRSG